MKFKDYRRLVYSDLYRKTGQCHVFAIFRQVLIGGNAFQYLFWMRTCRFVKEAGPIIQILLYPITKIMLRRAGFKFGISIPPDAEIGAGFYIGHFGGIIISSRCRIGANCNISQGVTLGKANRGKHRGFPVLGDNVYLGPGAKVVGGIQIGNNVAIGANCVVTQDIPDNAVVVGIPGKVISMNGSQGYINRTDYDQHL